MPPLSLFILMALVAGFSLPTQAGINAQLNLWTRSPVWAAAVSFAVGTAALILYGLALCIPWPAAADAAGRPWWIWSGGVLGAFFVAATVVLVPRLGAATMITLIVAGQMIASLLLDHYGLLGYPVRPMNLERLFGVALVVAGAWLIRRF